MVVVVCMWVGMGQRVVDRQGRQREREGCGVGWSGKEGGRQKGQTEG